MTLSQTACSPLRRQYDLTLSVCETSRVVCAIEFVAGWATLSMGCTIPLLRAFLQQDLDAGVLVAEIEAARSASATEMSENGLLLLRPDSRPTAPAAAASDDSSGEGDEQHSVMHLGLGLYLLHVWEVKPHAFASVRESALSERASRNAAYWSRALSSEVSLRRTQGHFSDDEERCSLFYCFSYLQLQYVHSVSIGNSFNSINLHRHN